jgi:hypothetical protein
MSFDSQLFFLQREFVIQNSQINYTKVLGIPGNNNDAASAYIQALLLAATHTNYGVSANMSGSFVSCLTGTTGCS